MSSAMELLLERPSYSSFYRTNRVFNTENWKFYIEEEKFDCSKTKKKKKSDTWKLSTDEPSGWNVWNPFLHWVKSTVKTNLLYINLLFTFLQIEVALTSLSNVHIAATYKLKFEN